VQSENGGATFTLGADESGTTDGTAETAAAPLAQNDADTAVPAQH